MNDCNTKSEAGKLINASLSTRRKRLLTSGSRHWLKNDSFSHVTTDSQRSRSQPSLHLKQRFPIDTNQETETETQTERQKDRKTERQTNIDRDREESKRGKNVFRPIIRLAAYRLRPGF